MPEKPDLLVAWCDRKAAKYAVERWHYSRCLPAYKQVFLGVWENGHFIGVVIFGRSTTPYIGTAYGLETTECVELTRVALGRHVTPVSRIVSISLKMLKRQSPGIRLVVSLADPEHDHHGGIYQAGNWIYVGHTAAVTQYYLRGKWRNDTETHRKFQRQPGLKETLPKRKLRSKYKYLMPMDKTIRREVELLHQPYPARLV